MLSSLLKIAGVYNLYETFLENQIKKKPLPSNIGIVLDGRATQVSEWSPAGKPKGPLDSNHKTRSIIEWCQLLGIKIITLLALPPDKKENDYSTIGQELEVLLRDGLFHRHKLRVKTLGDVDNFPVVLRKTLAELESTTSEYTENFLNIALENGGRLEIVEVVRALADRVRKDDLEPEDIDAPTMESLLFTAHLPQQNPDLIIRTSREERLTDFLLWQSAYSELVFLDVYWPAFRKIDLMRAIRTYQNRVRRFGQ
ncbi:MAG: polyprenyl diphosphate synthase [Nitrososphaerales archaeon]